MSHKEISAELNRIPIHLVGSWIGLTLPTSGSRCCPFHSDEHPSFEIKKSGDRWRCYACGKAGGAIDFVRHYYGLSFLEARRWLLARSQNVVPKLSRAKSREPSRSPQLKIAANLEDDSEVYEAFVACCPLAHSGRAYLKHRAFDDDTLRHFRVGQLPIDRDVAPDLVCRFGFSRVQTAGLLTSASTPSNFRLTFRRGYILFPILARGVIVCCQARPAGPHGDGAKYVNPVGRRPRTYNADALDTGAREIAVCEGVTDTMSAHQLGRSAIGLLGVSNRLEESEIAKLKGRRIELLTDWDDAGERKARSLRKELSKYGLVCVRKERPDPDVKDLNEYLIRLRRPDDAAR